MHKTRFLAAILGAVLLLVPSTGIGQQAPPAAAPPHQHGQMQPAAKGQAGQMTMSCQQMMQGHQKMMEQMKAMDGRLDTLVQQMNSASGQAKVDATAAVVNELVSQRKTMREGMEGMQGRMMQHMAEHMQAGGKGMTACPMMGQMSGHMQGQTKQ